MPNYIAASPSPQPAPRPVIDVGDIINQASNAFQANKQGVLTRAILQQKADAARQAQARQDAQFQLEQQRFGLAQRQQQTQEQLHAATLMGQGYEDVTGQPQTTTPDGKPQTSVSIGDRQYRLNPANTPDARKKSDRLKKLQAYNDALPATDPKRLGAEDIDLLSNDDNLFNTFTTHRLGLTTDPYETHKQERLFDIKNPLPTRAGQDPEDKEAAKKPAYILGRIKQLTAPQKGRHGKTVPGMSLETATEQAGTEWNAAHGVTDTEETPPPTSSASDPTADYADAAARYQKALSLGIDGAKARQAYNETVALIAKKHRQK